MDARAMQSSAADTTSRQPVRQALADGTFEAVKAMLMDHVIPPDARISIDGLARDLGVSPTPVRETLARLESDGLVVREAMRGYRATSLLNRRELKDLYEFRLLIEPWAAARAAEHARPRDREALQAELTTGAETPVGSDYRAYGAIAAHDSRFHDLITEFSGNREVRLALQRTHCHLHIFRLYYRSGIGTSTIAEHRQITTAITGADPDAARAAMRDHLTASRDRLLPACH